MKDKFLLIKGPFCFVFKKEEDPAPTYAISLAHMKAKVQPPQGALHVVTLETNLGDVEYEISFPEAGSAKEFAEVATRQASIGETEEVRKVSSQKSFSINMPHQPP